MKDGGIVTEISLEAIFNAENLQRAFESFEGKRDSCGADGVMVSDLPEYWNANQVVIKDTIYRIDSFKQCVNFLFLLNCFILF